MINRIHRILNPQNLWDFTHFSIETGQQKKRVTESPQRASGKYDVSIIRLERHTTLQYQISDPNPERTESDE